MPQHRPEPPAPPSPVQLKPAVHRRTTGIPVPAAAPAAVPAPATPSLPSMTEMARNISASLGRTVAAAVTGRQVKEGTEEQARRYAICRECPFFRASDERCSRCGCYLAVKTWLKAERCPVGKW